jgi:NTP pyrophosphatase (non-canonical NTP hydrolase)
MNEFQEYQKLASRTLNAGENIGTALANLGLGLAGEAGESVDYLKKILFHGHELNAENLASELGDILWYIAGICTVLKIDLSEVAQYNIQKLQKRYPEGFSQEDSQNRVEYEKMVDTNENPSD